MARAVVGVSTTCPPARISVVSRYSDGLFTDHRDGLATRRAVVTSCDVPAATLVAGVVLRATARPCGSVTVATTLADTGAAESLAMLVCTWTVAYPTLIVVPTSAVVQNVPHRATWT